MKNNALEIKNLTKKYNKQKILNNLSFNIPYNSITGIIGPNGAGKSTLLRIISGFEYQDRGAIIFNKKNLSIHDKRKYFSYMPEVLEIYPEYHVYEFINFLQNTVEYEDNFLIQYLGLNKVISKKIKYLSKGFKQRLKLFFALNNKKSFIILDEPFDGFDPLQIKEIFQLIKLESKKEKTFVISLHQLNYVEKICDYIVLLNNGNLVAEGNINQLAQKANLKQPTLEELFINLLK